MSIFQPQFLTVHDGCCLHEAHAFAAVGLAKYSSHESRYPSSVTLRSNGRSLPLRLINLQYKSWTSLGYCTSFCHCPLHHSHTKQRLSKKNKEGGSEYSCCISGKKGHTPEFGAETFSLHAPQSEDVHSVFPVFNSCFSAWVRLWTWSRTRLRLYGVLRQVQHTVRPS